jgi:hypothetical protein
MKYYGLRSAGDLHETVHLLESWRNEIFFSEVKKLRNAGCISHDPLQYDPIQVAQEEKRYIAQSALKFLTTCQPRIPYSFRKKTERKMTKIMDKALFNGDVPLTELYISGLKTELRLIKNARTAQRFKILLSFLAALAFGIIISCL